MIASTTKIMSIRSQQEMIREYKECSTIVSVNTRSVKEDSVLQNEEFDKMSL